MNVVILYTSVHHGNTKKVVEGIAKEIKVDLYDICKYKEINLDKYDLIGLASGVFYHGLHEQMNKFIQKTTFAGKQKVFLITTCGIAYRDYTKEAKKMLSAKGVQVLGSFQCRGFDTFGAFEKIGGIAKDHPNENDIKNAQEFVNKIIENY